MSVENNCPDKESSILYKFRDWDNNYHRSILIHNNLYLPLISELNDPFDSQLRLNMNLVNTDEEIEHLLSLTLKNAKEQKEFKLKADSELEKMKQENKELIKTNPEKFLEDYMKAVNEARKSYISVLSFSEVWNNILLWTHYSNNHSGFCVGFDKQKLDSNSSVFGLHGKVYYADAYPIIDIIKWNENTIKSMLTECLTKSTDWKYECEYRYIRNSFPDITTVKGRTSIFEDGFIKEVIVGLNISSNNEKEIQDICSRKNIPLYKIQKSNSQFILERKIL